MNISKGTLFVYLIFLKIFCWNKIDICYVCFSLGLPCVLINSCTKIDFLKSLPDTTLYKIIWSIIKRSVGTTYSWYAMQKLFISKVLRYSDQTIRVVGQPAVTVRWLCHNLKSGSSADNIPEFPIRPCHPRAWRWKNETWMDWSSSRK